MGRGGRGRSRLRRYTFDECQLSCRPLYRLNLRVGIYSLEYRPNVIQSGSPFGSKYIIYLISHHLHSIDHILTPSVSLLVSTDPVLTPSGTIILPNSFSETPSSAGSVEGGRKEGYCAKIALTSCLRADERIGVALDRCASGFLNISMR